MYIRVSLSIPGSPGFPIMPFGPRFPTKPGSPIQIYENKYFECY